MKTTDLHNRASKEKQSTEAVFRKLKKKKISGLDNLVHTIHNEVFSNTDCLSCANCCRSLGPRITERDIIRLARCLHMSSGVFINTYLKKDEDDDFVFAAMPCPFLQTDNYCTVYENRPVACRDYPHTDRKKMIQLLDLTLKNSFTCPAVLEITIRLKKKLTYGK